MKVTMTFMLFLLGAHSAFAKLPLKYTDLVKYVQPAPDQGETATCLYQASTGAVELLLNQKYGIENPDVDGRFDISERYAISSRASHSGSWHEMVIPRFNSGWAIHQSVLPFTALTSSGQVNRGVWNRPADFYKLERMQIDEQFETVKLFIRGDRYDRYVIKDGDIQKVKEALVTYNAPILINYNDEGWWHAILIVGYDDFAKGDCYLTPAKDCSGKGAFIVRDSTGMGMKSPVRDYGWFKTNANAAFVVKIADEDQDYQEEETSDEDYKSEEFLNLNAR